MSVLVIGLALIGVEVHAHGDGHARIEALSRRLASEPANVELLLQRANAWRAHGHGAEAAADLERARALGAPPARWRMARARLWLDQGTPAQALSLLEQQLQHAPADTVAMAWRAEALSALGRHREAADQFAVRLPLLAALDVADYLAWAEASREAGDLAAALAILDQGLVHLGPLVVMQRRAIELLERQQHWPQALQRLQALIDTTARKEGLLWWRSRLEQAAGLTEQAEASRLAAAEAWKALPPAQRATPAMQALGREIGSL